MADDGPPRAWTPLLVGAAVGLPVTVAALAFVWLVHELEHLLWDVVPAAAGFSGSFWLWVLAVPTVGGFLAGLAVTRLPGHGGHSPIDGLAVGAAPPRELVGVLAAALASLPFGAVLGPEAPLVAIGATVGAWASRRARLSGPWAAAGSQAGVATALAMVFGNPVLGLVAILEIAAVGGLGGSALVVAILPAMLATGVGYLIFTGVGGWAGVTVTPLSVTGVPAYPTVRLVDLVWTVVIAVLVTVMIFSIRRAARTLAQLARAHPLLVATLGGTAVGGLAVAVTAGSVLEPEAVLFSGQAYLGELVTDGPGLGVAVLLALIVAKALAYGISLACGFRGGPVFPALALGVAAGTVASLVLPGAELTPAIVAGMAAATTATLRLPVSSLVLTVVIAGGPGLEAAPAAIAAVVVALVVGRVLDRARAASGEEQQGTAVPHA